MNRFRPAVLAPYGTPLKTLIPLASMPRTLPNVVSAITVGESAAQALSNTLPTAHPDAAGRSEACFRNWRRDGFVMCGILRARRWARNENPSPAEELAETAHDEPAVGRLVWSRLSGIPGTP